MAGTWGGVTTRGQGPAAHTAVGVTCSPQGTWPQLSASPPAPSLTFLQVLDGGEVAGTKVQPNVYLRGDPHKPEGVIFEKQVLLPGRGAEELEPA